MFEQEKHVMELERTYPSGAQEWYCPTCGRRCLMQWDPSYKKIVLEPGDERVSHSGTAMDIEVASPMGMASDAAQPRADSTSGTVDPADLPDGSAPPPWLKWLDDYDPAAD